MANNVLCSEQIVIHNAVTWTSRLPSADEIPQLNSDFAIDFITVREPQGVHVQQPGSPIKNEISVDQKTERAFDEIDSAFSLIEFD